VFAFAVHAISVEPDAHDDAADFGWDSAPVESE
jgi:hypothetical protein